MEIGKNVVDVLGADGETNGVGLDTLIGELLLGELAVGRGSRMDDQALDIGDVGQQREDLQAVNEFVRFLHAALDLEGKDRTAAVGEVLFIQCMVGMIGQGRMVDVLDLRMVDEEIDNLFGVFRVALQTEREGLGPLQQEEGVERRERCTGVAEQDRTDVGNERRRADRLDEGDTVIAGVGIGDGRVFAGCRPVKLTGVHDDAAQRRAVAADELGCRVDDDICTVLDGTDEIGGAEGVIHDQRQAVLVGKLGKGVDVRDIAVGVAKGLDVDGAGVGLDSGLHLGKVMDVHEGRGDAEIRERVGQQIVAAAVDGLLCDDVATVLGEGFNGVGDRSRAGRERQRRDAAFEGGDTLLEHILRGVGEAAVDVAGVSQAEAGCRVFAVAEDIGGGLIDRHCAGIGCGIGGFLAYMELKRFEFIVRHGMYFLSSSEV